MKRALMAAAAALSVASPAFATTFAMKFDRADGSSHTVTFNSEDMSATVEGQAGSYTYDKDSNKFCITVSEQENCVTLAEHPSDIGESTEFTDASGAKGTATLVSAE